jgi:hypothetical protein
MFYAQVRMLNPTGTDEDGNLLVDMTGLEWKSYPYVEPEECGCFDTVCRDCVESWEIDHEVRTPSWI